MKLRIVKKWAEKSQRFFYHVERKRRFVWGQVWWEYLELFNRETEAREYVKNFVERRSEEVIAEFDTERKP